MKFFKKFLAIFLCAIMIACIAPLSFIDVKAENQTYYDGVWAYQVEDGYAVLVGVSEVQRGEVCVLPSVLGGYPLRVIASVNCGAFAGINTTQVIIPQGVERIASHGFNTCGFISVVMPKSLKYIDFNAFPNCWGFTTIYYEGTETDWANISIAYPGLSNAPVVNATKHYGYVYEPTHQKVAIYHREFDRNIDYFTAFLDSSNYDPVLSNMLAALSAAAYDEKEIKTVYESLGFFNTLGITNDYDGNDKNKCGSAVGIKESTYNGDTVCLITLRGTVGDFLVSPEWKGNLDVSIRELEEHNSFSLCADTVYTYIEDLLGDRITDDDVKYVITGHSRGGAAGNLLADELMKNGVSASNVYNYNYAPPDTFCAAIRLNEYTNIFNLCNRADIVPLVPGPVCSALSHPLNSWMKHGQTLFFTQSEGPLNYEANHDVELYLKVFDLQLAPSDWPNSIGDIASDALRWLTGAVAKILCPVDVIVTDEAGNRVTSVIGGEVDYYGNTDGSIIVLTDGDRKVIYFADEEQKFNIDLIATDTGTMTYMVGKCNLATGKVSESKTFNNVVLEEGKTMYSSVSASSEISDVELFVVEEKDGEQTITHTINTDGTESSVETDTSTPSTDKEDSNESESATPTPAVDHSSCRANWWTRLWRNIFNFFRRLFGLSSKCVCGEFLN